jgi:hypothetical protein
VGEAGLGRADSVCFLLLLLFRFGANMATDSKSKPAQKGPHKPVRPLKASISKLTTEEWTGLTNWIPNHFLSDQMTFVVFDDWDKNFGNAILDKLSESRRVITLAQEKEEDLPSIAACALINPQWGDPDMKVGGGIPLRDLAKELLSKYSALIVVGKNSGNEPGRLIQEQAAKTHPKIIERMYAISGPGSSLYCFRLRNVATVQSTSSNESPATGRGGGGGGDDGAAAAAAAAEAT